MFIYHKNEIARLTKVDDQDGSRHLFFESGIISLIHVDETVHMKVDLKIKLLDGWLGSRADEGRDKLRYA